MANRKPMLRPSWTANVGALLDEGARVWAHCPVCGAQSPVDLAHLAEARGRDLDLWNRHPRCRATMGCAGRVTFHHDGRGVLRAMRG